MNEKNGFDNSISTSPDNCGICQELSPTIPESSSILSPLHCPNDCSILSNIPSSLPLSGTYLHPIGCILDSSNGIPANIPSPSAIPPPAGSKSNHQCFGQTLLTAADFSKSCNVHHINRKTGAFASTWRLRCLECTENEVIMDLLVDFVFCFLTTADGNHCFMVKIHSYPSELFLIRASVFSQLCPTSYVIFYNSIETYNSLLTDLSATIEDQKKVVEECFNSEILKPYESDPSKVDITKLPESVDAQNAAIEIRRLFFLELEYEMAEFSRTNINGINDLRNFVKNFYQNRNQGYAIINEKDVLQNYRALYFDILEQS
uniref:Uncharacterized protein n=1 Tax=Panagrolaimus sp. ES5 TaxID=591445 RepID=A0AC34FAC1_9BILA